MYIFIMRHGEAEPVRLSDEERKLTALGEKQSSQSAIWIKQFCQKFDFSIDLSLVSPFRRTQETFSQLVGQVEVVEHMTCGDIVPSGDPQLALDYIDVILRDKPDLQGLLLVSHMPFVSYFLDYVCQHHYSMLFSAGAVAVVKYTPDAGPAKLAGQFFPE